MCKAPDGNPNTTVSTLPGVTSASACLPGLFSRMNYFTEVTVEGTPPRRLHGEADLDIALFVGPEYFKTMGMPLLLGRSFTPQDKGSHANAAVINETMSRTLFGVVNPIGRHVT
jgi:putative ABC transport system permease protein